MSLFNGTKVQADNLRKVIDEYKGIQGAIVMVLQKAQTIYGYLPIEVQVMIAEGLNVTLEEVYGVVTFYSQFSLDPTGKYKVGVCMGTACYVKGAGDIVEKFKKILKIQPGQTSPDGKFTLEATRCIGCCGLAPVLTVNGDVYGKVVVDDVDKILAKYND